MKKALAATALLIFVATLAHSVQARPSRVYMTGFMGLNIQREADLTEGTTSTVGDYETSNGLAFAGALGVRLTRNWRLEGEISRRKVDMSRIDTETLGSLDSGGDITTWLYMMNAYYDFDFIWRNFRPYLTAGLGAAFHDAEILPASTPGAPPGGRDDANSLAWQLGGGLQYRLEDNFAFVGDYRYIGSSDLDIQDYNLDYSSHEIRVGIQYDLPVETFQ